jgi:hypothetical protein
MTGSFRELLKIPIQVFCVPFRKRALAAGATRRMEGRARVRAGLQELTMVMVCLYYIVCQR